VLALRPVEGVRLGRDAYDRWVEKWCSDAIKRRKCDQPIAEEVGAASRSRYGMCRRRCQIACGQEDELMPHTNATRFGIFFFAALAAAMLLGSPAQADRCTKIRAQPTCGLDSQTNPPTMPGGTGGCTDANLAAVPLFHGTGACAPGDTAVAYDLGQPFPDNGVPADQPVVGMTSFSTIRAGASSPCAHMIDTVDPKPCPDPQVCPGITTQPEGAIKVGITGYAVGCWSPPDARGCRRLAIYTGSLCLHAHHQLLGPGCTQAPGGVDCPNVSTEQVGIDVPGAATGLVCPPATPGTSCRGTRGAGRAGMRIRIGGVCSTNNCANPGTAPTVDTGTCVTAWGESDFGYNLPPGRGINEPGWYDWKTGAFRLDLSTPKPACGALGVCLGAHPGLPWDVRLVAVPRPGQVVPCVGAACDAAGCFP
jgi:hypothetical protein